MEPMVAVAKVGVRGLGEWTCVALEDELCCGVVDESGSEFSLTELYLFFFLLCSGVKVIFFMWNGPRE